MATDTAATTIVAIESINVADNVRDLDPDHVDRLAGSIQLQGILVPLVVTPHDGTVPYELVAGFHRIAAAQKVGLTDVPVVVRAVNDHVDRAVENIVRKDLTPHEEAVALQRALDNGLSETGAAQALGWSPARVTARKKILELPEDARPLVGPAFRTECTELLVDVERRAPKLWDRLMDAVSTEGDPASLKQLHEWLHQTAWRDAPKVEAWPAHGVMGEDDLPPMRTKLKDRWRGLVTKEYGYERPFSFSFTDTQLEQANAAGCYLAIGERGLVLDKDLVLSFAAQACDVAEAELAEERAAKKKSKETVAFEATVKDPQKVLQSLERRDQRDTAPATRAANVDLARSMMAGLSTVELTKDVAVFFSRQALGFMWDGSSIAPSCELARVIARRCKYAVEELREVIDQGETKAGKPKPSKVEYADDHDAAVWLRRWVEQPKDPAAILGRTLTVFAIASEVDMEVATVAEQAKAGGRGQGLHLPTDAAKALARIAKGHIPGSLKGVRREKAKRKKAREDAYNEAIAQRRAPAPEPPDDEAEMEVTGS